MKKNGNFVYKSTKVGIVKLSILLALVAIMAVSAVAIAKIKADADTAQVPSVSQYDQSANLDTLDRSQLNDLVAQSILDNLTLDGLEANVSDSALQEIQQFVNAFIQDMFAGVPAQGIDGVSSDEIGPSARFGIYLVMHSYYVRITAALFSTLFQMGLSAAVAAVSAAVAAFLGATGIGLVLIPAAIGIVSDILWAWFADTHLNSDMTFFIGSVTLPELAWSRPSNTTTTWTVGW